jgi:hypothetical protein
LANARNLQKVNYKLIRRKRPERKIWLGSNFSWDGIC